MANGAALDDAVGLSRQTTELAIGCHVDLIQLRPVLPAERVRTLVDGNHFRPGFSRFAARALRGQLDEREIEAEATAQMRKLQAAGVQLSHFDTHKHTHVFPPVLKALLRAAGECGVAAVRNPFEPESIAGFHQVFRRGGLLARWAAVQSLRTLARDFRHEVERAGMVTTDGTVGIALTGHMDQRSLCDLLRSLPSGTWELVTHPGYTDAGLASLSKLTSSREDELRLLTSAETRAAVQDAGIESISYADLGA